MVDIEFLNGINGEMYNENNIKDCKLDLVARNFYEFIGSPEEVSKNTTSEIKAVNCLETAKSKLFIKEKDTNQVEYQNGNEFTLVDGSETEKETKCVKIQQKIVHY